MDMHMEGTLDLLELISIHPSLKPDDQQKQLVKMSWKAKLVTCLGLKRF